MATECPVLRVSTQGNGHLEGSTESHPVQCGSQVFSLVIFSSLLTDGYQNRTESPQLYCVLNSNRMACSFAIGAGFLSFLSCLVFLTLDTQESRITGTRFKTAFQLLDFILAGEFQGTTQSTPMPTGHSPGPNCQTCA